MTDSGKGWNAKRIKITAICQSTQKEYNKNSKEEGISMSTKKSKLPEVYGIGVLSEQASAKGRVVYKHPLLPEMRTVQRPDYGQFTLLQTRYLYFLLIYTVSLIFLVDQKGYAGFIPVIIGVVTWLALEIWFYLFCKGMPVNKAKTEGWTSYKDIVKRDKVMTIAKSLLTFALGVVMFVYSLLNHYDTIVIVFHAIIMAGCTVFAFYHLKLMLAK